MIQIVSREKFKQIFENPVSRDLVVISINDTYQEETYDPPFDPESIKIADCLILRFDDVEEDSTFPNFTLMTLDDGIAISRFVDQHRKLVTDRTKHLYIHCTGGVSRSAAIAAAISCLSPMFDDWWVFNNPRLTPNEFVYRTMLKAEGANPSEDIIKSKFWRNQQLFLNEVEKM